MNISESTIRRIDYYFNEDAKARRVTHITLIIFGVLVQVLLQRNGLSEQVSFAVSLTLLAFTFITRLITYKPHYLRSSLGAKSLDIPKITTAGWWTDRRTVIFRLPAAAVAFGFAVAALPRESEAEILDKKLKSLLRRGYQNEAKALAKKASEAGIPLYSDSMVLIADRRIGSLDYPNRDAELLLIETPDGVAEISFPVIYLPTGRYRLSDGIDTQDSSLTGDGPNTSVLVADFKNSKLSAPTFTQAPEGVFNVGPISHSDVVVYGLGAESDGSGNTEYIVARHFTRRIFAINVRVKALNQDLDWIFWQDATFEDCNITYRGDQLRLSKVRFFNCTFKIDPQVPSNLQDMLRSSQGTPVTFSTR